MYTKLLAVIRHPGWDSSEVFSGNLEVHFDQRLQSRLEIHGAEHRTTGSGRQSFFFQQPFLSEYLRSLLRAFKE